MSLIRWGEDRNLSGLRREMNDLFDTFFQRGFPYFTEKGRWGPPIDVAETPETVIVKADVPGVRPEEIEISVDNNVLTIKGEKREEKTGGKGSVHWVERRSGTFLRSVTLPTGVDAEHVSAESKDGVLTVTLPKRAEARARKIEVKTS